MGNRAKKTSIAFASIIVVSVVFGCATFGEREAPQVETRVQVQLIYTIRL